MLPEHTSSAKVRSAGTTHQGQHTLLSPSSSYNRAHIELFARRDMAASKEVSCGPFLCSRPERRIFCRLWFSIVFKVLFVMSTGTALGRDSW